MATDYQDLFPEDMKVEENIGTVAIKDEPSILDEFDPENWMKVSEVAELFGVDPKTVSTWQKLGRLNSVKFFKTPGGHRRYFRADIKRLVEENGN